MVLECLNVLKSPIRPFDLDCPTLTVAKHYEEKNGFCGNHRQKTRIRTPPTPSQCHLRQYQGPVSQKRGPSDSDSTS